ncbi:chaplin [Nocardiopsis exhalans]|uniref:Chaplin n=1 Tax=Nocardiopsis exhalans TaxID=163604 RepID=A0ABY5D802_9ACTN|nr:chaplin family protein [Nocardiopsis exhalans]USY20100.1 chaplin [Nocardiopsis exhalans]
MRNTFRYSFATALTAGLVLAPFSAAFANPETDGSGGVGSGNQIVVPVDVEANLCGNALAVLGISSAKCTQVSEVLYESSGQGGGATTDGSGGVASGNQIILPVDAAIDACGNSVAVAGISQAECVEVVEVLEKESEDAPSTMSDGSGGVASGNQIVVPVDAAIDICGNSVAVLGASSAQCTTIINIIQASPDNQGNQGDTSTDGSGGVASGNQVVVPVDAAVQICGNAVSVLGIAEASCVQKISDGGDPEDPKDPKDPEDPKDPKDPEEPKDPEDPKDPEEPKKPEEPKEKEEDDKPAPKEQAGEELAVTGGALGGLIAAAVAAVGAGGAGLYFARKRKAAAATAED